MKSWIKFGISAICIFFVIQYFMFNKEELRLLTQMKLADCLVLSGLLCLIQFLGSYKYLLILRNLGLKSIAFVEWFRIFITSKFINFHITQGANVYRSVHLKNKHAFPYTKSIGLISTFNWFEILAILAMTIGVVGIIEQPLSPALLNVMGLMGILLVGICVFPFLTILFIRKFRFQRKKLVWFRDKLEELNVNILQQLKNPYLVLVFFILSIIIYLMNIVSTQICVSSIGSGMTLAQIFLLTAVFRLSKIVNVVPGNIGVTEILCGYLSDFTGGTMGQGILISGILRIVEYGVVAVLGIILNGMLLKKSKKG